MYDFYWAPSVVGFSAVALMLTMVLFGILFGGRK